MRVGSSFRFTEGEFGIRSELIQAFVASSENHGRQRQAYFYTFYVHKEKLKLNRSKIGEGDLEDITFIDS